MLSETSRSERTNKLSPFSIALSADANKSSSALVSESSLIASESDTENVIGNELTWNPLSLTALICASWALSIRGDSNFIILQELAVGFVKSPSEPKKEMLAVTSSSRIGSIGGLVT